MLLLNAHFENFRLLRDLKLDFSIDPKHKLTVIRAANETGKTTILHALQWGLYGDEALPTKGAQFRLHPIDWDGKDGNRVPITVTIEFEVVHHNNIRGKMKESRKKYRIIRSAFEELTGSEWQRRDSTVKLFELSDRGASPIEPPEAVIRENLPQELREVFFTDGDRALSFIESDVQVSAKRERVNRAIRSLLGMGIVEEAMKHVRKVASDVNKQAQALGGDADLTRVAARLNTIQEEQAKYETECTEAQEQFEAFDEKLREVDRKVEEVLRKGDKEKLNQERKRIGDRILLLDGQLADAAKEHAQLFKNEALAKGILEPVLDTAFAQLNTLHDMGKIPNATIPVLEERLTGRVCICGESLEKADADGARRRAHIQELIEKSRKADAVQGIVTELYYGSKSMRKGIGGEDANWRALYVKVVKKRDDLQKLRDDEGRKLKALEAQIDSLPNADIQGLRDTQRSYKEQRDRFHATVSKKETQIEGCNRERLELESERDRLLRRQKKGSAILSQLIVAQDIYTVLDSAHKRLTKEELAKVSELMNRLFLEMIGADPDQGAIIKKASISDDFEIIVSGPSDKLLDPDRDLNGASRRALTLAFILALTKVSEVEAPNVIDTPLGMMSGYVKRAVLRTAIQESSQLILFLTHSEISGCEEIIDKSAGVIYTLTNPAHFPKMLVHDPGIRHPRVLRCGCNHRVSCTAW